MSSDGADAQGSGEGITLSSWKWAKGITLHQFLHTQDWVLDVRHTGVQRPLQKGESEYERNICRNARVVRELTVSISFHSTHDGESEPLPLWQSSNYEYSTSFPGYLVVFAGPQEEDENGENGEAEGVGVYPAEDGAGAASTAGEKKDTVSIGLVVNETCPAFQSFCFVVDVDQMTKPVAHSAASSVGDQDRAEELEKMEQAMGEERIEISMRFVTVKLVVHRSIKARNGKPLSSYALEKNCDSNEVLQSSWDGTLSKHKVECNSVMTCVVDGIDQLIAKGTAFFMPRAFPFTDVGDKWNDDEAQRKRNKAFLKAVLDVEKLVGGGLKWQNEALRCFVDQEQKAHRASCSISSTPSSSSSSSAVTEDRALTAKELKRKREIHWKALRSFKSVPSCQL